VTAPEKPDALRIARWAWPMIDYKFYEANPGCLEFDPCNPACIHAAEQVAVERGHLKPLVRHLASALHFVPGPDDHRYSVTDAGLLAFAPLEARALALHRLVCELEEKSDGSV